MTIDNNTLLIMVVASVAVMLIGFGFRDRNFGIILAGIGFMCALAAAIYKAMVVMTWSFY